MFDSPAGVSRAILRIGAATGHRPRFVIQNVGEVFGYNPFSTVQTAAESKLLGAWSGHVQHNRTNRFQVTNKNVTEIFNNFLSKISDTE